MSVESKERPLLAVSRKDLDSGPKHVRASLPAAWLKKQLGDELGASKDGAIDFTLTPSGGDNFLLQGRVRATVDATCGRCLGKAEIPVDSETTLLIVPKTTAATRAPKGKKSKESEGEFEFDPDEADVATYDGETIVLDDLVREAILLELPISPLCREDCAGISSDPAVAKRLAEARVDPRLASLADFKVGTPHAPGRDKVRK
jgi:uncharacterized protein